MLKFVVRCGGSLSAASVLVSIGFKVHVPIIAVKVGDWSVCSARLIGARAVGCGEFVEGAWLPLGSSCVQSKSHSVAAYKDYGSRWTARDGYCRMCGSLFRRSNAGASDFPRTEQ